MLHNLAKAKLNCSAAGTETIFYVLMIDCPTCPGPLQLDTVPLGSVMLSSTVLFVLLTGFKQIECSSPVHLDSPAFSRKQTLGPWLLLITIIFIFLEVYREARRWHDILCVSVNVLNCSFGC